MRQYTVPLVSILALVRQYTVPLVSILALVRQYTVPLVSILALVRQYTVPLVSILALVRQYTDQSGTTVYHCDVLQDPRFFVKAHANAGHTDSYTTCRVLHYPPLSPTQAIKPGQLRCGEHVDYGSLSLLFQDPTGGLQVGDVLWYVSEIVRVLLCV